MIHKIGNTDNRDDIIHSWIYHYGLECMLKVPKGIPPINYDSDLLDRTSPPMNNSTVYSIDPEGCLDVDDAFQFENDTDWISFNNTYYVYRK